MVISNRSAVTREAFEIALGLPSEWHRSRALRGLVSLLSDEMKIETLAAARQMADPGARARLLTQLAGALDPEQKTEVAHEALSAVRAMPESNNADELISVASHLNGSDQHPVCREALAALAHLTDNYSRAWGLTRLVMYMPAELHPEALTLAQTIDDESARVTALLGLAKTQPPLVAEALALARSLPEAGMRAQALSEVVLQLEGELQAEVIREAWVALRAAADISGLPALIYRTAKFLSPPQKQEVWDFTRQAPDDRLRAAALAWLLPHLEMPQQTEAVAEAFAAAQRLADDWTRADAVIPLTQYLSPSLQTAALQVAREINDPWAKADLLGELADHLPTPIKPEALAEALQAARSAPSAWAKARALTGVATHLES